MACKVSLLPWLTFHAEPTPQHTLASLHSGKQMIMHEDALYMFLFTHGGATYALPTTAFHVTTVPGIGQIELLDSMRRTAWGSKCLEAKPAGAGQ